MTPDQPYLSENASELEHLKALAQRLTDAQLNQPLAAGWTIAAVLAHLAFWDQRALVLIDQWQTQGVTPSPIDADVINDTMRPLLLALPPRAAAELALTCAETLDQAIAQLDPHLAQSIAARGTTVHLNRAVHRRMHLEQIEAALNREE